jgi:hypothetical protein
MSLLNPAPVESPLIRVLFCAVCDTMESLPLYDGPVENDVLLEVLCSRHVFPSGEPHKGHLFRVPLLEWEKEDVRKEMIKQIKGGGSKGIDEFDESFYATKDTFKEDAMTCYNRHLRPKDGCPDYMSDKMILLPNTTAERKDAGLPSPAKAPGPKNHLCGFCPIQSVVMLKINDARFPK